MAIENLTDMKDEMLEEPYVDSPEEETGGIMYRLGAVFSALAQKYMPDAIIFALGLTGVVFVLGVLLTDASPLDMLIYHGEGLYSLLAFCLQVTLTLLFSNVVATTKPVARLLDKLTDIPKTPAQAYIIGYIISGVGMLLSWAIGLVVGGVYAKTMAKKVKGVDYAFLVATVYCSMCVWHGGLSGTIPLAISTEGSFAADYLDHLYPSTAFFLHPLNLILIFIGLIVTPLLITRMLMPPKSKVREVDPNLFHNDEERVHAPAEKTPAQKIEFSRITSLILAALVLAFYVRHFAIHGLAGLDLNSLNGVLFGLGVLFSDNLMDFNHNIRESAKGCGALMVQFPLYAGIMSMTTRSGLSDVLSNAIVSIATPKTLPNIINISSAVLNMIIPSGGGKFSVEAPIYIPAVYELKADLIPTMMGAAWGDALTNLIQPFWALPLLAIAKLKIKDIMGYCVIYCLFMFLAIQVVLAVYSHMF